MPFSVDLFFSTHSDNPSRDIVAVRKLPQKFKSDVEKLTGCISGAAAVDELKSALEDAGFTDIQILLREVSRSFIRDWFPGTGVEDFVLSASIQARKNES